MDIKDRAKLLSYVESLVAGDSSDDGIMIKPRRRQPAPPPPPPSPVSSTGEEDEAVKILSDDAVTAAFRALNLELDEDEESSAESEDSDVAMERMLADMMKSAAPAESS